MEHYGDEDYIYYLSNLLSEEKREREKDCVYIGEELVHLHDREGFIRAMTRYLNELIR